MVSDQMTNPTAAIDEPISLNRDDPSSRRAIILAILIFAVLSTLCSIFSKGFIAADACVHYMYARFCFREREEVFQRRSWNARVCDQHLRR